MKEIFPLRTLWCNMSLDKFTSVSYWDVIENINPLETGVFCDKGYTVIHDILLSNEKTFLVILSR